MHEKNYGSVLNELLPSLRKLNFFWCLWQNQKICSSVVVLIIPINWESKFKKHILRLVGKMSTIFEFVRSGFRFTNWVCFLTDWVRCRIVFCIEWYYFQLRLSGKRRVRLRMNMKVKRELRFFTLSLISQKFFFFKIDILIECIFFEYII